METSAKTKQATQQDIVIRKVFDLSIDKVWKAFTEEEEFKKWWGPKGFTCPFSELDPKVGGRYFNCMRGPDGKDYWSVGIVKELIPEKKLSMTDNFSDEKGNIVDPSTYGMKGNWTNEAIITIELDEADGATKFKLRHQGIPVEEHDNCVKGWNESLDKLEKNV